MAGLETRPKLSLFGVARIGVVLGALGALAYLAYQVVATSLQLGPRIAIRSVLSLIVPIFAASYAFVIHRDFVHRIQRLPAAVRFSVSLLAGALAMASLRFFLVLYPFPVAELVIASCIAILAFTSGSAAGSNRPVAPFGLAAGLLLYFAVYGAPRIAGG